MSGLGQKRRSEAYRVISGLAPASDMSLRRANRREGPIREVGGPIDLCPSKTKPNWFPRSLAP